MKLFSLTLRDEELSYENHNEDFFIGIFETKEKAENTAKYYLKNVKGFCDYNCTYNITEKNILDKFNCKEISFVWLVQGWNINKNLDETDMVESELYINEDKARDKLENMKRKYKREEWVLEKIKLGKLNWQEGFMRV